MSTKITKFDAKEPFKGVTSAFVAFEDKAYGFFEYEGAAPFKAGDEVEYTLTKEKSPTGKTINKLTITAVSGSSQGKAPTPAPAPKTINVAQMKHENRLKCMELAHEAYVAGKLDNAEAQQHAREWVALADDLTDGIFG